MINSTCLIKIQYYMNNSHCLIKIQYFMNNLNCLIKIQYFINNSPCLIKIQYFMNNSPCLIKIHLQSNVSSASKKYRPSVHKAALFWVTTAKPEHSFVYIKFTFVYIIKNTNWGKTKCEMSTLSLLSQSCEKWLIWNFAP